MRQSLDAAPGLEPPAGLIAPPPPQAPAPPPPEFAIPALPVSEVAAPGEGSTEAAANLAEPEGASDSLPLPTASAAPSSEIGAAPAQVLASEPDAASASEPAETTTAANARKAPADPDQPHVTLPPERASIHPQRRRQTPPTETWFASQGKYIAMGFGLALVATVIYSKATRPRPETGSPAVIHQFPGDAVLPDAQASSVTTTSASSTVATVAANTDVSPAKTLDAAASKAELHTPVVAQAAASDSLTASAKTDASLFPWAKQQDKSEERVASRPAPETPALIENPAVSRDTGAAALPATASSLPTPNYRSAYIPATSGSEPAAAPSIPSQPSTFPDNTARGPRYDRTGSGVY